MVSLARRRIGPTSAYQVDFGPAKKAKPEPEARLPRVVYALALAHEVDRRIRCGEVEDLARAAEVLGLTRARITQITSLLLLAPEIQEEILALPPSTAREAVTERQLRPIAAEPNWGAQIATWRGGGL